VAAAEHTITTIIALGDLAMVQAATAEHTVLLELTGKKIPGQAVVLVAILITLATTLLVEQEPMVLLLLDILIKDRPQWHIHSHK
jgi:hypothetical protein